MSTAIIGWANVPLKRRMRAVLFGAKSEDQLNFPRRPLHDFGDLAW
jgi:hypothetical protein